MKIDKNLNHRNIFDPNMKINIVDFAPRKIAGNKVYINDPGKSIPFGRKIKNFDGDIVDIKINEKNNKLNPDYLILKTLYNADLDFYGLVKRTKLSYDNLRWYLSRKKDSLMKRGLIIEKERKLCLYKNAKGGCVKIVWTITSQGKEELSNIKKEVRLPKRKELILLTSNNQIILSSWWSPWLKPNANEIFYNKKEERFFWRIPEGVQVIQYHKGKNILYTNILPKEVNINDELFITALGLLKGEMRKRKDVLSFSNTEPSLLNYVLRCFEYFDIKRTYFDFHIQVNTKNIFNLNKSKLLEYWSKAISVEKNKISRIYEYKETGSKRGNKGRIDFKYYNSILKLVFDNIIDYYMEKAKQNKKCSIYFLRGLLASEGYVSSSIVGALGRVAISSCSLNDKKQIIKMLRRLDITSSIYNNCVSITSKKNFDKIIEYKLLKISKDVNKFKKLYSNLKYKI